MREVTEPYSTYSYWGTCQYDWSPGNFPVLKPKSMSLRVCLCLQIIDSIVEHHLHRVYVVNAQAQAVGVVTLTDLLRKVTDEAQKA